jgi:hypothetical protein
MSKTMKSKTTDVSQFSNMPAVLDAVREAVEYLVPTAEDDAREAAMQARKAGLQAVADKLQRVAAVLADDCLDELTRMQLLDHAEWLIASVLAQMGGMFRAMCAPKAAAE